MKYSFMSFSTPEATLDEMFDMARRWGYNGIEPRIATGHRHGVEINLDEAARRVVRSKAEEAGVAIRCVASDCRFADPETSGANVEDAHRCVDLAADLGSSRIRVFGGQLGGGLSRESAIELVAHSLSAVADHAQSAGVVLCMETHDDWCDPVHVAAGIRVCFTRSVQPPPTTQSWRVHGRTGHRCSDHVSSTNPRSAVLSGCGTVQSA